MKLFLPLFLFLPMLIWASEGGSGPETSKGPLPPPKPASPENINTYLHIEVDNLTKAQPPKVEDRKILFTFDMDPDARYVAVAFAHEAYKTKHIFYKNKNNVYFLVYDIPEECPENVEYRLIVDGLWMKDPANSKFQNNDQNIAVSYVIVKQEDHPRWFSPVLKHNGEVEFRYKGKTGLQISVIGDFNHWDPFAHFLEEEPGHPGQYSLDLVLPAGPVAYKYVIGVKNVLDPLNPKTVHDETGNVFSYFENKKIPVQTFREAVH